MTIMLVIYTKLVRLCPWSNDEDYVISEVDVSVYAAVKVYYVHALLL